jgi:hypothetical protein
LPEVIRKYDIEKYPFHSLVFSLYKKKGASCLEELHKILPTEHEYDIVNVGNDNETWFHKIFYDRLNNGWQQFIELYQRFVNVEVVRIMGHKDFLFQKKPTFRVQIPNNKSVGEFHRDYDYNHQLGEINFVIPFTEMKDGSSIWTESVPGLGDYHPIEAGRGDIIIFNGNTCTHGNKINNTGITRVSMDFRILPKKYYDPNFCKSSTSKSIPMVVGGYYSEAG